MIYRRFLMFLCMFIICVILKKSNGQDVNEDVYSREQSNNGEYSSTISIFDLITKLSTILTKFDQNCHRIYTVMRIRDDMQNILEGVLQSNPEADDDYIQSRVIEKVLRIKWYTSASLGRELIRDNYLENTNWFVLISYVRTEGKSLSWRISEKLPIQFMYNLSSFLLSVYQIPFYDTITLVDHAALLPMLYMLYLSVSIFCIYLLNLNEWTLKYFNEHLANELDIKFLNSGCNCDKGRLERLPFWGRGPFSNRIQFMAWCVLTWFSAHRDEQSTSPTEIIATEENFERIIYAVLSTLKKACHYIIPSQLKTSSLWCSYSLEKKITSKKIGVPQKRCTRKKKRTRRNNRITTHTIYPTLSVNTMENKFNRGDLSDISESDISSLASEIKECREEKYKPKRFQRNIRGL